MKLLTTLILLISFTNFAQTWTKEELAKANTLAKVADLTDVEKEAVMYINLARMYPEKFVEIEVKKYEPPSDAYVKLLEDSPYIESLIDELNELEPMAPFVYDEALQEFASCFAAEQGASGYMGHKRKKCEAGNYAECCAYDMATGKHIAMQLLIDHGVPSLGHRINCLNPEYSKVGISVADHAKANICAVLDMY
jgi:hypothetical protein